MKRATLVTAIRYSALFVLAAAALVVILPLFAVAAFTLRMVILAGLVVGAVALAVSPSLRRWLASESELVTSYLGLRMPGDELLHPSHSWARIEQDGTVRAGVDDLLQKVLGPADRLELPPVGRQVAQGDLLLRLSRGGRTIAVRAPIAGRIIAVNSDLRRDPHLANEAPYGAGWAVKLEPQELGKNCTRLRRRGEARRWMRAEIDRLIATLAESETGYAMQDGGHLAGELHTLIDERAFASIKASFFGDGA